MARVLPPLATRPVAARFFPAVELRELVLEIACEPVFAQMWLTLPWIAPSVHLKGDLKHRGAGRGGAGAGVCGARVWCMFVVPRCDAPLW